MLANLTQKIIASHLVDGTLKAGEPITIKIDQTLTQDATGTMAWLQFEALGLDKVQNELALSYVDHNTLQMDFRNPDDHRFLHTTAQRFKGIFSPAGLGICHQLHLENFARPGATLLGSDSHTPTAGGIGSLAMGAGGLSVALAMAGEPYPLAMPEVIEVRLEGALKGFACAKDIILELLRRCTVKGGVGKVFEYTGSGLASLSVPERATITNMGAELGATASIFPSDEQTRRFLTALGRANDYTPLSADIGAAYDGQIIINLSDLVPLAAAPHMPDIVVSVAELAGLQVDQVAIGSCTNSSYSDMAMVADIFAGERVNSTTDVLISPGSKQVLALLNQAGLLENFFTSGARMLECACGPCIGSGGAPVSGGVSVRTFNRNFEGRSGTNDAKVYLTSPATAANAALNGCFTHPDTWKAVKTVRDFPLYVPSIKHLFVYPTDNYQAVEVKRGPNIAALEVFEALKDKLTAQVGIRLGDNITTDHIMPAGAEILALRSNIPAIANYVFHRVDKDFPTRARELGQSIIVAGENYGQGSSREHAALAPRHLGIRAIIAKSFARIHHANLVNFGILPLVFESTNDYEYLPQGAVVSLNLNNLDTGTVEAEIKGHDKITLKHNLSRDELAMLRAGGQLNQVRNKLKQIV